MTTQRKWLRPDPSTHFLPLFASLRSSLLRLTKAKDTALF